MLLTISTTHQPATDLGYLLHKNPNRSHEISMNFGKARVFFPEATEQRCTAALMVEMDQMSLVRRANDSSTFPLESYVNDRSYTASSFLSVAIARVFGTAMGGRSKDRPELAEQPIPLEIEIPTLPCDGGEDLLRKLFEPLGYAIEARGLPLDSKFPAWGASLYYHVKLSATVRLKDALSHLNVLIPVLDNEKHYWVGDDEVEKLLRRGEGWLEAHPEIQTITRRYLKNQRYLTREALKKLLPEDSSLETPQNGGAHKDEEKFEAKISLNEIRLSVVCAKIEDLGATSVIDMGCGEGNLLKILLPSKAIQRIVGFDVSQSELKRAHSRLNLDELPEMVQKRIDIIHGSLIYRDQRFSGFDAATVIEVIEHLDTNRLYAFERVLFEFARPKHVILTTPNIEFNARFRDLIKGKFRHPDHRFEWSRAEFAGWCETVRARFGYTYELSPIGEEDSALGAPTQMAVFSK